MAASEKYTALYVTEAEKYSVIHVTATASWNAREKGLDKTNNVLYVMATAP